MNIINSLKEIYKYRNMVNYFTRSELRNRYKGSVLGVLWSILNPLFLLLLYSFVFSFVMKISIPNYLLFLFSGLVPWICFKSSILTSSGSIVGNGGLIKKVYFPREIIVLSSVTSNFINMFIALILIVPLLFVYQVPINKYYLLLPLVIIVQFIFTLSLSMIVSAFTVFVRDLRQILDIVMMGLFYTTPIVYKTDMIPEKIQDFFNINPIAIIIKFYQDVIYHNQMPNIMSLAVLSVCCIAMLYISHTIFSHLSKWFAEHV
ncbi:ABC transporter permease [Paenibacillus timonensis]|uniref:ABC transporter permease n=1 Tax=Paenibacillus timonensis TaxID=225915 RepID=UPI003F9595B9